MYQNIRIKIGAYLIQVSFKKIRNASVLKSFVNYTLKYYHKHLKNDENIEPHVKIFFVHSSSDKIFKKENKKIYGKIASISNKNEIYSNYNISFSQMQFLIYYAYKMAAYLDGSYISMHASGVLHKDKVILFLGRSGAGKSTIIKLLINKGLKVFCDDICFMTDINKKILCVKFPDFTNLEEKYEQKEYDLLSVYIINKNSSFRIEPIYLKYNIRQISKIIGSQMSNSIISKRETIIKTIIDNYLNNIRLLFFQKEELNSSQIKKIIKQ